MVNVTEPAYKGQAVFGKTKICAPSLRVRAARNSADFLKNGYSVIQREPDERIAIPVPAIISSELFQTVSEQLEENSQRARQGRRGVGTVAMRIMEKRSVSLQQKGGAQYAYYRCTGTDAYRFGGVRVCGNKQVRTSRLDDVVWAQVVALLSEPEWLKKEYDQRLIRTTEPSGQNADVERLKKQKNQIKVV